MSNKPDELLEALATAITQWQHVEMELYQIFERLLQCPKAEVTSGAFHAVINFSTRLGMTHAAAHIALRGTPHLATWKNLHNRMTRRVKRRNELVHFILLHDARDPKRGPVSKLQPSIFDVNARSKGPKEYTCKDIIEISLSFGQLAKDLWDFRETVWGKPPYTPSLFP